MFELLWNRTDRRPLANRHASRRRNRSSNISVTVEIQYLERRVVPATVTWTGGAGDLNWDTAANWSGGAVPSASSDVVIAVSSGTSIKGSSSSTLLKSLALNSGQLALRSDLTVLNKVYVASGTTLGIGYHNTLTTSGTLSGTGTIDLTNDSLDLIGSLTETTSTPSLLISNTSVYGSGTLTIGAGVTQNVSSSTFNVPTVNQGTLSVLSLGDYRSYFNGSFANAGTLQLQTATNQGGTLIVASGFTNTGKIDFSAKTGYVAELDINTGGLMNAAGGMITTQGSGRVNVGAEVTNLGTMTVSALTFLEYYGGSLINTGTINLNAPTTLGYNSSGTMTNGGAINVNATVNSNFNLLTNTGKLTISPSQTLGIGYQNTLTTSGTLSGTGTIDLTNDSLDLIGSLTETTSTPSLLISNTSVYGSGTLTIGAGVTQNVSSSTFNVPTVNQGTLSVLSLGDYRSYFNGSFANTGTLRLQTATNQGGTLIVASGFTNTGKIYLSATTGYAAELDINTGGLLNAAGGMITTQGSGQIKVGAEVLNQGTLTVNASTTLGYYSGSLINGGTINLNAPTTLGYNTSGTMINTGMLNVNATTNTNFDHLTNTGTINIANGQSFTYQSITNVGTINTSVNPLTAAGLAVLQSPATATAGVAASSVKVAVYDHYGNLETTATSVKLQLASGKFSNGTTSVVGVTTGGIAIITGLSFNIARNYSINVTSGPLSSQSFNVTVNPAAASRLVFTRVPASGTHGVALSTLTVAVEDAYGNIVTGDSSSIAISVNSSNPAGGGFVSESTTTVAVVNGVATFTNLKLNKAGTYTLKAVDGTLSPAVSGNIVVS